jgi:hypothetical protein
MTSLEKIYGKEAVSKWHKEIKGDEPIESTEDEVAEKPKAKKK